MEQKYVTVSALNRYLKYHFDNDKNLQNVFLKAEISNFKHHSRGHLYFTLKDDSSQIQAVMFQSSAITLNFEPKDGDKVIIEGRVSIYEAAGNYQIYVKKMSLEGIGDLYQAYEALKKKLEEKGLFLASHKSPIPVYPKTIGVVTSPTGAAVRDIINIVNRRYPLATILIYPALVQGEDAKYSIVKMIRRANEDHLADVLIVGRGGGSIEDLWAFNEEMVAMAIYDSIIPVISAVGHETDYTIADFVADRRAPTPSGAAEIAVPDKINILIGLEEDKRSMGISCSKLINAKKNALKAILGMPVMSDGARLLDKGNMRLDHAYERLLQKRPDRVMDAYRTKVAYVRKNLVVAENIILMNAGKALQNAENLLKPEQLKKQTAIQTERLKGFEKTLLMLENTSLKNAKSRLYTGIDRLELVNPLSLMKKGYAIVKKDGCVINLASLLKPGEHIDLRMQDAVVGCLVDKIERDE